MLSSTSSLHNSKLCSVSMHSLLSSCPSVSFFSCLTACFSCQTQVFLTIWVGRCTGLGRRIRRRRKRLVHYWLPRVRWCEWRRLRWWVPHRSNVAQWHGANDHVQRHLKVKGWPWGVNYHLKSSNGRMNFTSDNGDGIDIVACYPMYVNTWDYVRTDETVEHVCMDKRTVSTVHSVQRKEGFRKETIRIG